MEQSASDARVKQRIERQICLEASVIAEAAIEHGYQVVYVLTGGIEAWRDKVWYQDISYEGIATPAGFARNLFFNGWHPVLPWLSFLLFGMVLGRLELGRWLFRRR